MKRTLGIVGACWTLLVLGCDDDTDINDGVVYFDAATDGLDSDADANALDSSVATTDAERDVRLQDTSADVNSADAAIDSVGGVDSGTDAADLPVTVSPSVQAPKSSPQFAQRGSSIAFDGKNYLVAWQEGPPTGVSWSIRAMRFSQAGEKLGDTSLKLSGEIPADSPQVGFDGNNFLVVWNEGLSGEIVGTRVSTTGVVLDSTAIQIAQSIALESRLSGPALSCHSNKCQIVFSGFRNKSFSTSKHTIYAVTLNTQGTPTATAPRLLDSADDPVYLSSPKIAFDGSDYMVIWGRNAPATSYVFSKISGASGDVVTGGPIISGSIFRPANLAFAFSGQHYLVAWEALVAGNAKCPGSRARIEAIRLSASGQPLDSLPFELSSTLCNQVSPAVSFDGSYWQAVWGDHPGGEGSASLLATRISKSSTVDRPPFPIEGPADSFVDYGSYNPATASDGKGASLVAYAMCFGGIDCSIQTRIVKR